jgi:WD40 repeat protein
VLTAGDDGTVRLWDTATGRPLTSPWRPPGPVRRAEFSPDGRRVLVVGDGGSVHLWRVPVPRPLSAEVVRAYSGLFAGPDPDPGMTIPPDASAFRTTWERLRRDHPDLFSTTDPPGSGTGP